MKTIAIRKEPLLLGVAVWWLLFGALELLHFDMFGALALAGFLSLSIIPGALTMLALRMKGLPLWAVIASVVGFSLLELMVTGLLANWLLPLFGIAAPLAFPAVLGECTALVAVLGAACYARMETLEIAIARPSARSLLLAWIPILFVPLAIFGAIRLNDGGSDILTMVMLGAMAIYICILIRNAESVGENAIPTSLFFMGLSLLLMTTLRGWFVTGHDIQREMQFFEIVKSSGYWNISAYPDPYNACLSITILPTIFFNLMGIADQYIFKFVFQIYFALCPVLAYLVGRHWVNRRTALIGALYFISFPTFFTDMGFLVRQEIAFVFFGLLLYFAFDHSLSLSFRRALFLVFGLGVVLSHYSTTYTVLAILLMAIASEPLIARASAYLKGRGVLGDSALAGDQLRKPVLTLGMVAILLAASFVWTSIITHTGGVASQVFEQTVSAVEGGFGGDNRSIDAQSLLSFFGVDPSQSLTVYQSTVVDPLRAAAAPGTYFASSTYSQYPITVLSDQTLPLTAFARFIDRSGIPFATLSGFFARVLAKFMEILAPLGVIGFLLARSRRKIDMEFALIAFYCLVFIFLNLVLPVLSAQYGVFRAMQQSLFVLGIFVVLGSDLIGGWLVRALRRLGADWAFLKRGEAFSAALLVAFFLYSTAFIPQLLGGNVPELHLNDAGPYYENYVTKDTDIAGTDWLMSVAGPEVNAGEVQFSQGADRFSQKGAAAPADITPSMDIYPGLVKTGSYVYLSEGTVQDGVASFSVNGDLVTYSYPTQFLSDNKDLIYDNGGSEVYK